MCTKVSGKNFSIYCQISKIRTKIKKPELKQKNMHIKKQQKPKFLFHKKYRNISKKNMKSASTKLEFYTKIIKISIYQLISI